MGHLDKIWDDAGEEKEVSGGPLVPLWTVDFEDDKAIKEWFVPTMDTYEKLYKPLHDQWRENLNLYRGDHYAGETPRVPRDQLRKEPIRTRKYAINHIYELTEQWTSRLTKFKPNVAVLPTNDEHGDRNAAKMADLVWKHVSYINKMDMITEQMARHSRVFGLAYALIRFNFNKGPVHPDAQKAEEEGVRVPLKGVKTEDGKPVFLDRKVRVGEVEIKTIPPWRVYLDPKSHWDDVDYCIIESSQDIDELKADYPEKNISLTNERKANTTTSENTQSITSRRVKVYEIWHKQTDYLDGGRYIKMTKGTVLENSTHPYSHRELPLVRMTDIDLPGELIPQSFITQIAPINRMYNNVTSLMYRNIALGAHPKWLLPKGACKLSALGNTATVVEYAGGVPPRLETFSTISPEMFSFRGELRTEAEQISGVHGVSRGEPPPGIRAGIALQFLEEQENQRANSSVVKFNQMIRDIAEMTIGVAGDYYDPSDSRLVRVLGKDNQWIVKSLDSKLLTGPFDIRIQNSSALPDSKAGRTQALIDLYETFGAELVPPAHVADQLDMAQPEKFLDYATVALKKAEAENEEMMDGKDVDPPSEWEEQISHWRTHMKAIQDKNFKQSPAKAQNNLLDHLLATEYLIFEKMKTDPTGMFNQQVAELKDFPALFVPEVPEAPAVPGMEQGMPPGGPMGQAPQGLPDELMAEGGEMVEGDPVLPGEGVPIPQ